MKGKITIGRKFVVGIIIGVIFLSWNIITSQGRIRYKKLADGVEHWYRIPAPGEKAWFFRKLEDLFNVDLSPKMKLPFGKSVAFLVGVSDYKNLSPQLPYVKNDLRDMRQLLLATGGFDEVYLAQNEVVNRFLIEKYMKNNFPGWLSPDDRLLFYYSGHGADAKGRTGYIQFSGAKEDDFTGNQILPIKDVTYWCDEIKINHLLFIFDCCASGLAFTSKGITGNDVEQILSTLSRNGSRTIITAGTAEEQTYEVPRSGRNGNGVFTLALMNALKSGATDRGKDGFLTIDEVFAGLKDEVNIFAARYKKKLTPRLWPYDESNYRGTFIFLNPEAKNQHIVLGRQYSEAIAAKPKGQKVAEFGTIQLMARLSGSVYIDGSYEGRIAGGDVKIYDKPVGRHKVELRTVRGTFSEFVVVTKGKVHSLALGAVGVLSSPNTFKKNRLATIFREIPTNVSDVGAKKMVEENQFFHSKWNKSGKGYRNQFEIKYYDGKALVIDYATGLIWQQGGSPVPMNYKLANDWVKKLNDKKFAGFDNWRLPTLQEAMSLMEPMKINADLYIDLTFDAKQRSIWTSDYFSYSNWAVYFESGTCDYVYSGKYYIRAVRTGKLSPK